RIGDEHVAVRRGREPVAVVVPHVLDGRRARGRLGIGEVGDRVVALDRQRRRFGHRGTDGGREGKAGYEGGEGGGVASAQVGRHGCAPAGFDKGVDDREDITGWVLRNEMRARKVRENPEIYGRGATAWSEIPSTPVDERTVLVRLLDIPGQVPA